MYNKKDDTNVFDIVLLDAASSAFYMASILVVFYLVNMAEGVNVSNAVRDGQGATGKLSSGLGNAAGGAASGAAGKVTAGARKLVGKIGSGIKGGFNKFRGK